MQITGIPDALGNAMGTSKTEVYKGSFSATLVVIAITEKTDFQMIYTNPFLLNSVAQGFQTAAAENQSSMHFV